MKQLLLCASIISLVLNSNARVVEGSESDKMVPNPKDGACDVFAIYRVLGHVDAPSFGKTRADGGRRIIFTGGGGPDCFDAARPENYPLDGLILDETPLLTDEDIEFYDWKTLQLHLKPGVADRLPQVYKPPIVFGVPFVVIANGQRIYLGAFWTGVSSYLPNMPTINLDPWETLDLPDNVVSIGMTQVLEKGEKPTYPMLDKEVAFALDSVGKLKNAEPDFDGQSQRFTSWVTNDMLYEAWREKKPMQFGPVQEMTITLNEKGRPEFLDLRNVRMMTLPWKYKPVVDREGIKGWAIRRKLPLAFNCSKDGFELTAYDAQMGTSARFEAEAQWIKKHPKTVDDSGRYVVDVTRFDTMTPRELMKFHFDSSWGTIRFGGTEDDLGAERNQRVPFCSDVLPAIIQFWDSQGQLGLLHIQSYDHSKRTISLRWKLVEVERKKIDESVWGQAIEGARIGIDESLEIWGRSDWPHPVVRLKLRARNDGQRGLLLPENGQCWQVEVNGDWYEWVDPRILDPSKNTDGLTDVKMSRLLDFNTADVHSGLNVEIAGNWRKIPSGKEDEFARRPFGGGGWVAKPDDYGEELIFKEGSTCQIRAAITCQTAPAPIGCVRLISNPVNVKIGLGQINPYTGMPIEVGFERPVVDFKPYNQFPTGMALAKAKERLTKDGFKITEEPTDGSVWLLAHKYIGGQNTNHPLTEKDYDGQGNLVGSYIFSDYLSDPGGDAPGRITAVIPREGGDPDHSFEMDTVFEFVRPGVWLLKTCHSKFRDQEGGSAGCVESVSASDSCFLSVLQLLDRLEKTEHLLLRIHEAEEGRIVVPLGTDETMDVCVKAIWTDKAKESLGNLVKEVPRNDRPVISLVQLQYVKVDEHGLKVALDLFSNLYWKEFETAVTVELLDSSGEKLSEAAASANLRTEGSPCLTPVEIEFSDIENTDVIDQIAITATVQRMTAGYHGHGMWFTVIDLKQ